MNKKNIIYLLTVFLIAILLTACQDSSEQNNLNNNNKDKSITENDSNNTTENNRTAENNQEDTNQNDVPTEKYSEEEKKEASQAFLDWAIPRAEEGGMAVTDNYFGHGASGSGDWYAMTEDGEILVQEQDPRTESHGYDAFDIHALVGVVFYTSNSDVTGLDKSSYEEQGGAGGGRKYTAVAEPNEPLHKYLLGDNGVVYELKGSAKELDSYQTGFGLYDDHGENKLIEEEYTFKVSEDQDAQDEWVKILENINN